MGQAFVTVFNPTSAKQWYAQQAQQAIQSGNGWIATGLDVAGGYVSFWTGSPASMNQGLAAAAFSTPLFGFGGAWGAAVGQTQQLAGATSAITWSANQIMSGATTSFAQAASKGLGLFGNLLGSAARNSGWTGNVLSAANQNVNQMLFRTPSGQLTMGFAHANAMTATLQSSASYAISAFRFGNKIGDAVNPSPQVGGVLFDDCDAILCGIGEISGAYWDAPSQSVVLIGKESGTGKRLDLPLPAMDNDLLRVAIRAALLGQPLGVSIDPPAKYRYGKAGDMPPDRSPLLVSYLGNSGGTLAGAIMFEADRIMKCLSVGLDNKTRKPFAPPIPGFRDLFQMSWDGDSSRNQSWHRFWFVTDHVELRKSPQSIAVTIGDVRIKVLTELEMPGSPKGGGVDPNDLAFSRHLTEHYDEYAKEFPILARLKELAKIAAVAKFLVNQKLPLDLGAIFNTPSVPVAAPETTPSIIRTESNQNGNITRIRKMSGGVDMDNDPVIQADASGATDCLQQSANAARASTSVGEWRFQTGNVPLKAKAIALGATSSFRPIAVDHQFPSVNGHPPLMLRRIYDSSRPDIGEFGAGWCLFLPFSLKVFVASGKRDEVLSAEERAKHEAVPSTLLLRDLSTGTSQIYRALSDGKTAGTTLFGGVTAQTVSKGAVSFQYSPADVICFEKFRYSFERRGVRYEFNAQGQLLEMCSGLTCLARCVWQEGRLQRMENDDGKSYMFEYPQNGITRIHKVKTTAGQTLVYAYDQLGLLRAAQESGTPKHRYSYDLSGRLVENRNNVNGITTGAVYGSGGFLQTAATDRLDSSCGCSFYRTFTRGRIASLKDDRGTRADFSYNPDGILTEVIIQNRCGHAWKLEYNIKGAVSRIVGPQNQTVFPAFAICEQIAQAHPTKPAQRSPAARLISLVTLGRGQHLSQRLPTYTSAKARQSKDDNSTATIQSKAGSLELTERQDNGFDKLGTSRNPNICIINLSNVDTENGIALAH